MSHFSNENETFSASAKNLVLLHENYTEPEPLPQMKFALKTEH